MEVREVSDTDNRTDYEDGIPQRIQRPSPTNPDNRDRRHRDGEAED